MMRLSAALLAAGLCMSGGSQAQDSPSLEQRIAAAHEAEERGAELYVQDRAIALVEDQGNAEGVTLAVPIEGSGKMAVSFFDDRNPLRARSEVDQEAHRATLVARYSEADAPALEPLQTRLRAAYATATSAADGHPCEGAASRTNVLPPRADGIVPVYRLTLPKNATSVSLGRSERFDIAPDGSLSAQTVLADSCETVSWDADDDELTRRAYFTTLKTGLQPNEIHAFAGHFLPFPMGVVTGEWVWPVLGGSIAEPVEADPEMSSE